MPTLTRQEYLLRRLMFAMLHVRNTSIRRNVVNYGSNNVVEPKYVLLPSPADTPGNTSGIGWYQFTTIQNGVTFNDQGRFPPPDERCVAYERECATRGYELDIKIGIQR